MAYENGKLLVEAIVAYLTYTCSSESKVVNLPDGTTINCCGRTYNTGERIRASIGWHYIEKLSAMNQVSKDAIQGFTFDERSNQW
jgi:hypothetical protein